MNERLFLYPLWVRIWHICNAIFFLVLLATGLSMQYSSPDLPILPFEIAVSWHNVSGVAIIIAYVLFLIFLAISPNKRHYKVRFKGLMDRILTQLRYYLFGIFKKEATPFPTTVEMKFNPLQQITYVGVLFVIFPILGISGLALMFPELIVDNVFGIGGTLLTAIVHASAGFLASMFLIIHLYFATIGATFSANFKSIINGYHEVH